MDTSTTRPKVAQLTFRLLGRSIHPELFHTFKSHQIHRDCYSASLRVTSDGHVVSFWSAAGTITEVTASTHQLLPSNGRILELPLVAANEDEIVIGNSFRYRYRCALERVPPEMFWMIQNQLRHSGGEHELLQFFDASGRIPIGGVSFIHVDSRRHTMQIQAIHTFPDDLALVKVESSFTVLSATG
ncbi:MAG: hypothetical protein KatS3mg111_0376 [Pirellulaceae bacterium]|nr:MAG: hypothetical protein KatS3mg111_0376 [Pirellulaceae bacterium]